MITLHVDLPAEFPYVEVSDVGDAHDSDGMFDEAALVGLVNWVLESPYRYVTINGDMLNMALKHSKSDIYSSTRSPREQAKHMAKILFPIAKRILYIGTGNHEERVYQETGLDVSEWLAIELGVETQYVAGPALLFISFGVSDSGRPNNPKKCVYSIYINHGFGGGKKAGGKLNSVMSLNEIVDADIYIMNHVHTPITAKVDYFRLDYQNKKAVQVTRGYLIGNAWLKYGGYGERLGFAPGTITICRAKLNGRGKKHFELTI